jgi:DNA-binding NarL/FixJ family response regulator
LRLDVTTAVGRLRGVSQRTVEEHLEVVRTKLEAHSRAAAWLRTASPAGYPL